MPAEIMDNITIAPKSASLASPKLTKAKASTTTMPSLSLSVSYGCEHIQEIFKQLRKVSLREYALIQTSIHDRHSVISQTLRSPQVASSGRPVPCLTPTYLCLQCPSVNTPEQRDDHWKSKSHAFCPKKRKYDDITSNEDPRLVAANTQFVPCRAIGLRGLYNMGQTCFMSVVLQSLIHNPFIKAFYLGEGHKSSTCEREKEGCTSCALDEIFTEFHSKEITEGYGAVYMLLGSWMGAQALAGYQQQDAHEYMQFILNSLHLSNGGDSISSSNSNSNPEQCTCIIHKTFYGQLQSTVTCDKCRNVTNTFDPFIDLSLDLRSQVKKRKLDGELKDKDIAMELKECLERFTGKEKLAAADYTCQSCSKTAQNATKQLSIRRLPPVLSIHLKRFEHAKTATKLNTKLSFPIHLDMHPYTTAVLAPKQVAKDRAIPSPHPPSTTYELSSVIVHKGNLDSGHYVGYCKEGGDWFLFDDSKVVLVEEREVLKADAYLLFYVVREFDGAREP
ncbi:ubiquitin carboxyl-terminal hydrolase 2 [Patellaria atrata CBS 101060]|uniref:Ubiquitin carboxyl-terminal hydrolase n=1 Tax=Patellaria atrata CBS 101060 TaxID=1346257 RepID=A0A9P4S5F6_9PEZI|nr:ubiquitin carboxyl-terminal hydrolase 2 [Patellaria atrata CBS 101060]